MAFKKHVRRAYKAGKFAYKHRGTAQKALTMAKSIKRLINVEKKYFDVATSIGPSTTPAVYNLFTPAQGDTQIAREGNSVKPLNLIFHASIATNTASVKTWMRIIFFKGNNEHSVVPTAADILATPSNFDSQYNFNGRHKYSVLLDRKWAFVQGTEKSCLVFNFNKYLKGHIEFAADGSQNIENHGIYMLYLSSEVTNVPVVGFTSRVFFTDN